jgi:ABC-type branched-subunit amino acid transport system ATPase component
VAPSGRRLRPQPGVAGADDIIDILGLGELRDRPTGDLSTGTRCIVELGCLLAQDPAVVLLDEPSAGIAQRESEELGPLLRRVQQQTGGSLVIIEHDMALLAGLCDVLVALEQGAVIAWGPPDAVLGDPPGPGLLPGHRARRRRRDQLTDHEGSLRVATGRGGRGGRASRTP